MIDAARLEAGVRHTVYALEAGAMIALAALLFFCVCVTASGFRVGSPGESFAISTTGAAGCLVLVVSAALIVSIFARSMRRWSIIASGVLLLMLYGLMVLLSTLATEAGLG